MTAAKVGNAQAHNERQKESYVNQDIVPERTPMNVHFKSPSGDYTAMFDCLVASGTIFTRGLKSTFRWWKRKPVGRNAAKTRLWWEQ